MIKVQSYRATVQATVDNLSLVKDHRRVGCNRDEGGLCIGKASIDFSTFQRLKSRVRVWVQVWVCTRQSGMVNSEGDVMCTECAGTT